MIPKDILHQIVIEDIRRRKVSGIRNSGFNFDRPIWNCLSLSLNISRNVLFRQKCSFRPSTEKPCAGICSTDAGIALRAYLAAEAARKSAMKS